MDIQMVEFYPKFWNKQENFILGHLQINLPSIGISILGILVMHKNNKWIVKMPKNYGNDHKTGEQVGFPVITFDDPKIQRKILKKIEKEAPDFIFKRLLDPLNPITLNH